MGLSRKVELRPDASAQLQLFQELGPAEEPQDHRPYRDGADGPTMQP